MGAHRYTWRTFSRELMLIIGGIVFVIPVYLVVELSLKPTAKVFTQPLAFPTSPDLHNYSTAWKGTSTVSLGRSLLNSTIITGGSVICLIVIGSLCAYTIARNPTKMGTAAYIMFLIGIIMPFQLGIVPIYVVMRSLHLTPSYYGQILLNTGLLMPLSVFLYTGFIRALPRDYEEAAQVDGAGLFRTFVRVIFPLLGPITGTVAVLTAIVTWNDFFLPLVFLGGSKYETIPVVMYSFVGDFLSQWNYIFATVVVAVAPVLAFYVIAQKQLMRGFSGGIRG